jgi:hypothetical protein
VWGVLCMHMELCGGGERCRVLILKLNEKIMERKRGVTQKEGMRGRRRG